MTNNVLTYGQIAKRAVMVLENTLVFGNKVFRGYEEDFSRDVNGYKPGQTITIRRPAEFVANRTTTAVLQDATEGTTTITVDQPLNISMSFTSRDMTLDITDFSERFIEPAMVAAAQQIDGDVASLFKDIPNWVGTPGNVLGNYDSFAAGIQRMNDTAVPVGMGRCGILSPRDARGLQSSVTGPASIFAEAVVKKAYVEGELGRVAGCDIYESQNTPSLLTGTRTNGTLNGGTLSTTWLATKDTNTMTLAMTGLGASGTIVKGEVFTLAGVFDVNPRSKAQLPYLKQFVVTAAVTADGAGAASVVVSPPIITSGAYQNVSAAPASNAAVTWSGAASTTFINNVIFNKNAFALVMVPLEKPEGGAAKVSRMSHKGFQLRVTSFWDGINDNNIFRFDALYGVKTIDNRQAVRLSGT